MKISESARRQRLLLLLAPLLVILGFIAGTGYQTVQHARQGPLAPVASPSPSPPQAKGLRLSPDQRRLAFTLVYDPSKPSCRIVLDLQSLRYLAVAAPLGWQDFVDQWSPNGRDILFERERIPRAVEDATPGLYRESVRPAGSATNDAVMVSTPGLGPTPPVLLTNHNLPPGEKVVTGSWLRDGRLMVRTRREPQSLYLVRDGASRLVDRAAETFYQSRPIVNRGRVFFLTVRDIPSHPGTAALYRVEKGQARSLGPPLPKLVWAYVSDDGRWLIACSQPASAHGDWQWDLYRISEQATRLVRSAVVNGDVAVVYESPDHTRVLGAGGHSLWLVAIPSLQVSQLGHRNDWDADDATWLGNKSILVAAGGAIWKVSTPAGTSQQLWLFPTAP